MKKKVDTRANLNRRKRRKRSTDKCRIEVTDNLGSKKIYDDIDVEIQDSSSLEYQVKDYKMYLEGEDDEVYNKIRASREEEMKEYVFIDEPEQIDDTLYTPVLDLLRPNTSKNIKEYIEDMNNDIELFENMDDDKFIYLGSVECESQLTDLNLRVFASKQKVPFVWVKDIGKFMYLVNWVWTDTPELAEGDNIYKDDDIALKEKDGEIVMMTFKDLQDIDFNKNKIANIISALRGHDTLAVMNVIDCIEAGWQPEVIASMDNEIMEGITLEIVQEIYNDFEYWANLTFNIDDPMQIAYEDCAEQEDEMVDMVEVITDEHEGIQFNEAVQSTLDNIDMASIYNEIVNERQNQENAPFEPCEEEFDDFEFDEDEGYVVYEPEVEEDEYDFEEELFEEEEFTEEELFDDEIDSEEDFEEELFEEEEFTEEYGESNTNDDCMENGCSAEEREPDSNSFIISDIFTEGFISSMCSPESRIGIPYFFSKLDTIDTEETHEVNYFIMDDDVETEATKLFSDQDLLAIVKFRMSTIQSYVDSDGNKPFDDNKVLAKVLEKIVEAQMWLDLWTKLN